MQQHGRGLVTSHFRRTSVDQLASAEGDMHPHVMIIEDSYPTKGPTPATTIVGEMKSSQSLGLVQDLPQTKLNLTPPTFAVRNTMGREKEQASKNPDRPAPDVALREYYDNHYHQLFSIIPEKVHNEKVQQEKLKEVNARLNFEGCSGRNLQIQETSQYSESRTPNKKGDLRRRLKPRRSRSVSRSSHRKAATRVRVHEERSRSQKVKTTKGDIGSQSRENRSQASKRKIYLNHGHARKQIPSPLESATSNSQKRAECQTTVWLDDLPPESIDSYDDLKKAFLANYLQQKKCIKDPVEIHHIKQREGESTEDFVQRFKAESSHVKGAPKCMRIFGFMHEITNPELIKCLHNNIAKSVDEMMRITTVFLRGEMAASNQARKKAPLIWKQQEVGRKQNFNRREISEISRDQRGDPWQRVARQKVTQSFSPSLEISFLPLRDEDGTEGYMIIEAEIGGHFIHRIYVDRGSASEILYEHCFNRLRPEVKIQMIPATAPLIGFSGEIIWPMGKILLPVKIGDAEHFTFTMMNFVVVRSPSPYNEIIGRPGVRKI
ncbi:reverse transcriptase domain-containing protein [Tanacetum coccineum]